MISIRNTIFVILAVCGLIAIVAYLPVVNFDFVWDDKMVLVDSAKLRSGSWTGVFTEPFFLIDSYYRPLVLFSFMIDVNLSGLSAMWLHSVNLLIFICNSGLVFMLARQIASHTHQEALEKSNLLRLVPWLAMSIYFIHPLNIESTAWISGRFDLLVTMFLLITLVLDGIESRLKFKPLLMFISYLAACLCKEMAVTLPIILFGIHYLKSKSEQSFINNTFSIVKENITIYLALFLAGVCYLVLRLNAMGALLQPADDFYMGTALQHLLLSAKAFGMYFFSAVLPFAFSSPIHKEYFPIQLHDRFAWVSLAILLIGISYSLYYLVLGKRRPYAVLALLFIVALIPVLHIKPIPIDENIIQERFMAFPLVFFSILSSLLLVRLLTEVNFSKFVRSSLLGVFSLWLISSSLILFTQIPLWRDNLVFWHWARQMAPNSALVAVNMASELTSRGEFEEAKELALLANGLKEGSYPGSIILANIYMVTDELDKAKQTIETLLNSPLDFNGITLKETINTYGIIHQKMGDNTKALDIFTDILDEDPIYFQALVNRGSSYYCLGLVSSAKGDWDKALLLMPSNVKESYIDQFEQVLAGKKFCN